LAIVFDGGIDSGFGIWKHSLCSLVDRLTPAVITGYSSANCDDSVGCQRLLQWLGAKVVQPTVPNPFRCFEQMPKSAFYVGICGRIDGSEPLGTCARPGCANPGASHRCSRCKTVGYCSPKCQKAHWKDPSSCYKTGHKHACVKMLPRSEEELADVHRRERLQVRERHAVCPSLLPVTQPAFSNTFSHVRSPELLTFC
jgi:hypothetical protein